jgi:uncharacterized protein (UPF0548 family)
MLNWNDKLMLLFHTPNDAELRKHIKRISKLPFSYQELGITKGTDQPRGFVVDHSRTMLGGTDEHWERARKAVRDWRMFQQDWIKLCWPYKNLERGVTVAILASHFGFNSLSGARIVYAFDEPNRYGFAYGTTTSHMECGEERFLVERLEDGTVWFDLYAVSRPKHILAKLFYPLARRLQRKFAVSAAKAMQKATERPADVKPESRKLRELF